MGVHQERMRPTPTTPTSYSSPQGGGERLASRLKNGLSHASLHEERGRREALIPCVSEVSAGGANPACRALDHGVVGSCVTNACTAAASNCGSTLILPLMMSSRRAPI